MKRKPLLWTCAAVLLSLAHTDPLAGDATQQWTVKKALKQIDRATKDLRWLTADVSWNERLERLRIEGEGKVWVDLAGRMRGEVQGSNPRTILITPPYVYVHKPAEQIVEVTSIVGNRDLLVQYVMLGFRPAGSGLKKDYKVESVRAGNLEGREVLQFVLIPKSKEVAAVVPFITLWIDQTSWFPRQLQVRHGSGGMEVNVHFGDVQVQEEQPVGKFAADWPESTEIVRK